MTNYLMLLAATDPWANFMFGFDEDNRFALLMVVVGCISVLLLVLSCVFAGVWSSAKHKRLETELKQDMLDRGMSAEEIEQVIEATPKEGIDSWIASWKKSK